MKKKVIGFILLVSAVFCVLLISCKKERLAYWDVDLVSPIARGQLNIKNFFGDSLFTSDAGHLLHLSFSKKIAEIKVDTMVKFRDTTINYSFVSFFTAFVAPNAQIFQNTQEINFNIPFGARIRDGILRKATLKVKYTNSWTQPLKFVYVLPSATKGYTPFSITEIIPAGATGLTKYYNFDGYNINMTGQFGNEFNTIVHTFTVYSAANASPDTIHFGQGIKAEISYNNIVPDYVEGYFGQQQIVIPYDSTSLGFAKSMEVSNFKINSAYINFRIINDFGVDISGSINHVKSVNTYSNTNILLNAPGLSDINVNRATKTGVPSYPVNSSTTNITITSSNSNLKQFIENLPNYLTYQGKININPFGNISATNDFAYYNTGVRIYADVDVPLQISADYFKLSTNLAINFKNVSQLNNINYGKINFNIMNSYPFKVKLQAYLVDANNNIIDSLLNTNNTVGMAAVNSNNDVISSAHSLIQVDITKGLIEHLKQSKSIKLVSYAYLPPSPPDVKIYDNYTIDVVITADVNCRTIAQ